MKLEVLVSCMHQENADIAARSRLTGNVLIVNQCGREETQEFDGGRVKMLSTMQRGLTRSRNMAIGASDADVCLLCDDDETFLDGYEEAILNAYCDLPQADVIIFKMRDRAPSFDDRVQRLRFPKTMRVSSWQISFRRESLNKSGVRFDELLGAGTGNGAEEELKFLLDCQRKGLEIWYVPSEIASVSQEKSTWYDGFTETFFENRGATTRYILGFPLATAYALYYVARKRPLYQETITPGKAFKATMRGVCENRIAKQAAKRRNEAAS